ncbi:MAG: chromosome segregation protein [Bacilli bacterium]|nr:chromosome segregation protein [Bacilli bacterium]
MYLKRMELTGFKSFADRTELEFVPGVTAVVGPNGSGKSNVSDSIRWVLGEQSAKNLRGSKMEDVIFSGSDSRRSVNFCEVSLTLDNSDGTLPLDFSEVTVTRRVYRSGDSEYLLNRQSCRLKDITELFMDTGLGKEAYSIIGQGRIEEILSTKSEDRRGIFEEAAGIVRYKSRKREAEKRLEETEGNLVRIHDVLHEIEQNLEPLARQKEVAEHYKQIKADLAEHEISLAIYTIEELDAQWKLLSGEIDSIKELAAAGAASISGAEADMLQVKLAYDQKDSELTSLQDRHLKAATEWEQTEGEKRVLLERIAATSHLLEESHLMMERLTQEQKQVAQELSAELKAVQDVELTIQDLLEKMDKEQISGQAMLLRNSVEQQLETQKAELIQFLNQAAVGRNELRNLETNLELIERRIERFTEEERAAEVRAASIQETLTSKTEELTRLTGQSVQLQQKLNEFTQELTSRQAEREQFLASIRRFQTELASKQSRLDLLRDMQQEYGGYNSGVRAILQAADRKQVKGICGAVADLIKVSRKYEVAIETALGGSLQHVVVETDAAGKEAIVHLKRSGGGRATFLPLNVIKSRRLQADDRRDLERKPGYIGIASELVETDRKYTTILENLLGQVVVAESIQVATEMARSVNYRTRIVTLDGDVVNPGGSMTGGSEQKRSTSLLARTREIADLETECTTRKQDLTLAEQKVSTLNGQMDGLRKEAQQAEQQLASVRSQTAESESERRELSSRWQSVSEQTEGVVYDKEQLCGERDALRNKTTAVQTELTSSSDRVTHAQAEVDELEQRLKLLQAQHADLSEELTQFKVQLAAKDQELRSRQENVNRHENRLKLIEQEIQAKQQEHSRLSERLTQIRVETETCETQINLLKQQKDELEQNLVQKRTERALLQKAVDDGGEQIRLLRDQLKQTEAKFHQSELALTRTDVELSAQLEKLAAEYQMSFEWAKAHYPLPEDPQHSRSIVHSLRQEVERLGDVNLGSIEEYARQLERFEFLTGQRNDLVEAKTKIYDVITEMDAEMSKRFMETFTAIREHFHHVFGALFGGGRADLLLVDPDHQLTTGIDIVAQPPGKKLQNLSLLSGGERALTAMALLFSILHVKPVPFCVLDEVEAALDEANVTRFVQYLRSFSSQTQFIAITHRRGTMEGADVLYGVTMQESGISKLVSVKLHDLEPMHSSKETQGIA